VVDEQHYTRLRATVSGTSCMFSWGRKCQADSNDVASPHITHLPLTPVLRCIYTCLLLLVLYWRYRPYPFLLDHLDHLQYVSPSPYQAEIGTPILKARHRRCRLNAGCPRCWSRTRIVLTTSSWTCATSGEQPLSTYNVLVE
jgi:hypothetical protein